MSLLSPESQAKMMVWRQKCLDGTITQAEVTEAMTLLRGDRSSAMTATAAAKRTAAQRKIPSAKDLLDEMGLGDE